MKLIALLGPDGAGKSTLIEELRRASAPRSIRVHHFRVARRRRRDSVHSPYAKESHPLPLAVAKVGWWLIHHSLWGLMVRLRAADDGSEIVVFDRFLYDVVADPVRYRLPPVMARLPIVPLVWPRPDLLVVLQPPPTTIQRRKQEVSADETRQQWLSYERLAPGRIRVLRVRNARPPAELARQILSLMIESR